MSTHPISLFAIFFASLLGSLHCVAMCGGFVSYCSANSNTRFASQLFYHLGRLFSYLILGLVAGLLAKSLDKVSIFAGFQEISSLITGFLLIFWGLKSIFGRDISVVGTSKAYSFIASLYKKFLPIKEKKEDFIIRSFIIGALSAFLPCVWLYSYVAVAAATSSIIKAILVMFVFWSGTLPLLALLGGFSKVLYSYLGKYIPKIISFLFIVAGLFSIYMHYNMNHDHSQHHNSSHAGHSMHQHH